MKCQLRGAARIAKNSIQFEMIVPFWRRRFARRTTGFLTEICLVPIARAIGSGLHLPQSDVRTVVALQRGWKRA
jgi:hypothetical protein